MPPVVARMARLASTAAVAGLFATTASAQRIDGSRTAVARADRAAPESSFTIRVDSVPRTTFGVGDIRVRRLAPLSSAIVPGSGQFALGNDRFIVYAAAELIGWWRFTKSWHEQSQQEAAFKQIARTVARAHFSTAPPDGDWTYYETMRDYPQSGVYSMSNNGSVVPETDTSTYNGHLWQQLLATNTTTAAALSAYEAQAIKPDFQWSWLNANLQFDQYKRTTDKRNDASHAAIQDLLFIAANHVLSMVDAFATFRLEIRPEAGGRPGASIGASARW